MIFETIFLAFTWNAKLWLNVNFLLFLMDVSTDVTNDDDFPMTILYTRQTTIETTINCYKMEHYAPN